ncbi:agmatine deiminase family protein [Stieleria varia]|uniref:Agmatine deiminase n=1 Tax=Stieleria varia TaxID=2528005 RepID=A0A5C5ZZS0_9BACT|nr:agmatine deiminase family protein [Stieleria varia]TWT92448.1 Agmatine deiminase [Stieleria varia]
MKPVRVPAEWEPQSAIWLTWPHSLETWPGRYEHVPPVYRDWISKLAPHVNVCVLADQQTIAAQSQWASQLPSVHWIDIETNDSWIRDYGPSFVVDDETQTMHAINWRYNAWGGKYPPWDADDAVAPKLAQHIGLQVIDSPLCVEGGAMEWDGTGRLLTTSECLVTDTRNPGWTKQQITDHLIELTGAREINWIDGGGLIGDDTDGHIDQLARFVDTQNVVVAVCDDADDENAVGLEANFRQLQQWGEQTLPRVKAHRLPIPPPRDIDGQRVPESYCNFLRVGPKCLLVPTFRSPDTDAAALQILSDLCRATQPDITVIPVDCYELIWGLGALHCASLNQPSRSSVSPRR